MLLDFHNSTYADDREADLCVLVPPELNATGWMLSDPRRVHYPPPHQRRRTHLMESKHNAKEQPGGSEEIEVDSREIAEGWERRSLEWQESRQAMRK